MTSGTKFIVKVVSYSVSLELVLAGVLFMTDGIIIDGSILTVIGGFIGLVGTLWD